MTRSLLHRTSTCSPRVLPFKSSPQGRPGWRASGPAPPRPVRRPGSLLSQSQLGGARTSSDSGPHRLGPGCAREATTPVSEAAWLPGSSPLRLPDAPFLQETLT